MSPVPAVDIFILPPNWDGDRYDDVLRTLSYSYVTPHGLMTWDASEFLQHVQQEAVTLIVDLPATPIGQEGWQI